MPDPTFPAINIPGQGDLYARFVTNQGTIVARLEEKRAPRTVANFVGLATGTMPWTDPVSGAKMQGTPLYSGVRFHRVIPDFMVQCGDPFSRYPEHASSWGRGKPGYAFSDEFHPELRHQGPGILSMANSGPGTNGSQFFITHRSTPHLDDKHSVFGKVVAGQNIVDKIGGVPTGPGNRPLNEVVLERVEIFRSATPPNALTMRISLLLLPLLLACAGCSKTEAAPAPAATAAPTAAPTAAAASVREGAPAPDVDLPLQDGRTLKLSSFKGKTLALYFYPKDNTPGCTAEAQGIRDQWAELQKAGIEVVGVSTQDADSHKAFIDQEKLPFPLAVDTSGKIAAAFEVPVNNGYAARHTILIGKDGKILKIWRQVTPKAHAGEILAAAKGA